MADRLVLHVGPRKTGSTYLQRVLVAHAADLEAVGVLYPTRIGGRRRHNHVSAVFGAPEVRAERTGDLWAGADEGLLLDLAEQVRRWPGTAIVSAEALGGLQESVARQVLARFPDIPMTTVITARDLGRVVPSSWVQHVRNGHGEPFRDYVDRRIAQRGGGTRSQQAMRWEAHADQTFWRSYCYAELAQRWQRLTGDVVTVTVPASGSGQHDLWLRFRAATGIDHLPINPGDVDLGAANVALPGADMYLLRSLNRRWRKSGLDRRAIKRRIDDVIELGLRDRPQPGPALRLDEDHRDQFTRWSARDARDLLDEGARVVGAVSDLIIRRDDNVPQTSADDVARAGAFAVVRACATKAAASGAGDG